MEVHGGVVPQSFEELEQLPGVGHKTASVVICTAFGYEAAATHSLSSLIGLIHGTCALVNLQNWNHSLDSFTVHVRQTAFRTQLRPAQGQLTVCKHFGVVTLEHLRQMWM